MVVEDLQTDIPLAGRKAVVVLVSALALPKGEELLTGSALIRQDAWKAVVNATLDAVNRRVSLAFFGRGNLKKFKLCFGLGCGKPTRPERSHKRRRQDVREVGTTASYSR